MDICIVTTDNVLARFLMLELREAGFSAERSDAPDSRARLAICDLDSFSGEIPEGAIGFSYDESRRRLVNLFLHRPISAEALISAVTERLAPDSKKEDVRALTLATATRKIITADGEVRLSEKELALLKKLCETPLLSRAEASVIFGEGESNVVDVYMHYLRKKLKTVCPYEVIRAKRSEGYSLVYPVEFI